MTTKQKSIPISDQRDPSRPAGQESSVDQARERLAGLLPDDALQDALKGLEPDEITGPGGLVSQLAGRVIETALGAELTERSGRFDHLVRFGVERVGWLEHAGHAAGRWGMRPGACSRSAGVAQRGPPSSATEVDAAARHGRPGVPSATPVPTTV